MAEGPEPPPPAAAADEGAEPVAGAEEGRDGEEGGEGPEESALLVGLCIKERGEAGIQRVDHEGSIIMKARKSLDFV